VSDFSSLLKMTNNNPEQHDYYLLEDLETSSQISDGKNDKFDSANQFFTTKGMVMIVGISLLTVSVVLVLSLCFDVKNVSSNHVRLGSLHYNSIDHGRNDKTTLIDDITRNVSSLYGQADDEYDVKSSINNEETSLDQQQHVDDDSDDRGKSALLMATFHRLVHDGTTDDAEFPKMNINNIIEPTDDELILIEDSLPDIAQNMKLFDDVMVDITTVTVQNIEDRKHERLQLIAEKNESYDDVAHVTTNGVRHDDAAFDTKKSQKSDVDRNHELFKHFAEKYGLYSDIIHDTAFVTEKENQKSDADKNYKWLIHLSKSNKLYSDIGDDEFVTEKTDPRLDDDRKYYLDQHFANQYKLNNDIAHDTATINGKEEDEVPHELFKHFAEKYELYSDIIHDTVNVIEQRDDEFVTEEKNQESDDDRNYKLLNHLVKMNELYSDIVHDSANVIGQGDDEFVTEKTDQRLDDDRKYYLDQHFTNLYKVSNDIAHDTATVNGKEKDEDVTEQPY
jgi:hypothetical protein